MAHDQVSVSERIAGPPDEASSFTNSRGFQRMSAIRAHSRRRRPGRGRVRPVDRDDRDRCARRSQFLGTQIKVWFEDPRRAHHYHGHLLSRLRVCGRPTVSRARPEEHVTPFELLPVAVASVAAVMDVRWRRIPNWLTLAALAAGVLLQVWEVGLAGIPIAFAVRRWGCVPAPVLRHPRDWRGRRQTAGRTWRLVGPQALVSVAIYGAVVGGVISVVILAKRGLLRRSLGDIMTNPTRMRRSGAKAPYGVAIAMGVYLSMLLPSVIG